MELNIIVPCYNEQEVLPLTAKRLKNLMVALQSESKVASTSQICFVDDGSRDRTWEIIEDLARHDPAVHGVKLSGNRGHQSALLAGLLHVSGDCVVTIDADLQDDEAVIREMVDRSREGFDIVYGVRDERAADTAFKRVTAEGYYRFMAMMGVDLVFNHADFRLMTRTAIEALRRYDEVNLFLRGIIPQLGFRTASVTYKRVARPAGESKYPLPRMLALAVDGITSFSVFPLRVITVAGSLISTVSLGLGLWALGVKLFNRGAVPGWASTVVPMYFLGGIQLLGLGIIGEYVAKTYMETKRRPRYIIEKSV